MTANPKWMDSDSPLAILAPMDGYTDPPFRRFIKSVAPGAIVFSEFLAARHVAKKPSLAKSWFKIYPDEEPVVIQLYGREPQDFRIAAALAEAQGAAGVDINMGCPAKKVVAHRHGSALMRDIDSACEIVRQVKAEVTIPVSVKTRLGWEDESKLIPFAEMLCDAGLDAITIHGRTYRQKFDGEARWEPIYELKEAIGIPVFGNGDITDHQKAVQKLNNLDGVMIGRGAIADPWLMARVCDALAGRAPSPKLTFAEKKEGWKHFASMMVAHAGPERELAACQCFRKYLVRLHRELGLDQATRRTAVHVATLAEIHNVLDMFAEEQSRPVAEAILI